MPKHWRHQTVYQVLMFRPVLLLIFVGSSAAYATGMILRSAPQPPFDNADKLALMLLSGALLALLGTDLFYLRPHQILSKKQLWFLRSVWIFGFVFALLMVVRLHPIVQIPLLTMIVAVLTFAWGQKWYQHRTFHQHVVIGILWVMLVSVGLFSAIWWTQLWYSSQPIVAQLLLDLTQAHEVPDFVLHTYQLWAFFVLAPSWLCAIGVAVLAVSDQYSAWETTQNQPPVE